MLNPSRRADAGRAAAPGAVSAVKSIRTRLGAIAVLLGFTTLTHAALLVSNTGQGTVSGSQFDLTDSRGQSFTTGPSTRGYEVDSVEVDINSPGNGNMTVELRESASNGKPGTLVCALNGPSPLGIGNQQFTAPADACSKLESATDYFVVASTSQPTNAPSLSVTDSLLEDSASFGWTIGDVSHMHESGSWSDTTSANLLRIRVNGEIANEAPVVSGPESPKYLEGATSRITYRVADPDGDDITWSVSGTDSQYFSIVAESNGDGKLSFKSPPTYDTAAGATNAYDVTVTASDGTLEHSLDVTVAINRFPVWSLDGMELPPGTIAIDFVENDTDQEAIFTLTDPENDSMSGTRNPDDQDDEEFQVVTFDLRSIGALALRFDPNDYPDGPDYESPNDGDADNVYELTVRVWNRSVYGIRTQPITVTVTNVYEVPETKRDDVTTDEDEVLELDVLVDVLANDFVDGGAGSLSVTAVGQTKSPDYGSVVFDSATNTITYTPNADFHGRDSFSYTVADQALTQGAAAQNGTDGGTIRVTVASVNDPPETMADTPETTENVPVDISVLANDTDADGDPLTVTEVGTPNHGRVELDSATNTVTYTPPAHFPEIDPGVQFISEDTFTYTVSDGTDTATGTVTVSILAGDDNSSLSNLTISSGSLVPIFDADETDYGVDVSGSTRSVTVTPATTHAGATVTVNGAAVTSGSASAGIALNSQGNATTIEVKVTAQNRRNTEIYTVTVYRSGDGNSIFFRQKSGNDFTVVNRGSLNLDCQTSDDDGEQMCPDNYVYLTATASVTSNTVQLRSNDDDAYYSDETSPRTSGTTAVTDSGSGTRLLEDTWSADISLQRGVNYDIWVSVDNGFHHHTRITTCFVPDVALSSLMVASGVDAVTLYYGSPQQEGFDPLVSRYTATVSNAIENVTVTPTLPNDPGCPTVTVNGAEVSSGQPSTPIALRAGVETDIPVVFTNGPDTETYTIAVTRELSGDANLSALTLSDGVLMPLFDAATTSYAASVANDVATLMVTPTTAHTGATVTVDGTDVTSGNPSGVITLTENDVTTVAVAVTAQDRTTSRSYQIDVTRAASDNANLSDLTLSVGELTPLFDATTTSYAAVVANDVATLTVTPTTAHPGATVTVDGTDVTSGSASGAISLAEGVVTTVAVAVTAQDGTTSRSYQIDVTRIASGDPPDPTLSDNVNLSDLTLSDGELTPLFDAATTSYAAVVANDVATLTVTPTAAHSGATVTVDDTDVTSGSASGAIALNEGGVTDIAVTVTAEDGTTSRRYQIEVIRTASGDANLSTLTLSDGELTPTFDAATTSYAASVANDVATLMVTPTTAHPGATVTMTVNGTAVDSGAIALNEGGVTTVAVTVTAQDRTTSRSYQIDVTRAASGDANLSTLTLSDGELTPTFDAATTSYAAVVANDVATLTVTPTTAHPGATVTVTVNGTAVDSGAIALNEGGVTTVAVTVTAQDRTTSRSYQIDVTRAASGDANLSTLTLSDGELTPPFDAATTSYAAVVANDVATLTVTPTTAHPGATVTMTVNGTAVDSGAIALNESGVTAIAVAVTAQDGTTSRRYQIDVTRTASGDANLSTLTLSNGELTPTFDAATTRYAAVVANEVATLTVTPTTAHPGATVTMTVNGTAVDSGAIALNEGGVTAIAVTVTAQDRTTSRRYQIDVTRAALRELRFGAASYEALEGGAAVTITVILDQPPEWMLTIPIVVATETAEAGDHEVSGLDPSTAPNVTGSLTFDVNQGNARTFTITALDEDTDSQDFDDETVLVSGLDPSTDPNVTGTLTFDVNQGNTRTFTITALDEDTDSQDFEDETVLLSFGDHRGTVLARDAGTATLTIIDDEGIKARPHFRRLNREILSKHALAIADVTIAAVTSRQAAGPACAGQVTTGSLGGSSTVTETIAANGQALDAGSFDLERLLGASSFRLRLAEEGSGAGGGCLTLWGRGDYRHLSNDDSRALDWNGGLVTGQVGMDALLRPNLLAGLAVSWSDGDFDYTDQVDGELFNGAYGSRMGTVHPYVAWWSPIGLDIWATGGYGSGTIEIDSEELGTHSSDTALRLISLGASGPLLSGAGLGGATAVRLKAQASAARMEVAGHGPILEQQTIAAQRLRLVLEGSNERTLAWGASLTPSFEVGLRHDGGSGTTGTGWELSAGLSYVDPALGLTVESRGSQSRVLAAHDEAYEEWGVSGLVRVDPGSNGQGLSLSLAPSYGQTAGGVQQLWNQGLPQGPAQKAFTTRQAPGGRLAAEVGYGRAAFAGRGLVTPYARLSLGDGDMQEYRVGSRLALRSGLRLNLEGTRQITPEGQADHGILLQLDWQY